MKKNIKYFFICILFFCIRLLNAQESDPSIDSLLNVLKILSSTSPEIKLVKGSDTALVNTLNLLSKQYRNTNNFREALHFAEEAQQQGEKLNYRKGIAVSYNTIGTINSLQGNYQLAMENYQNSLKIHIQIKDKKGISVSFDNIGIIYEIQGNYQMALENQLKALKIREEIKDKKGIALAYNNIGNIYEKQINYIKAMDSHLKSLKISTEIEDKNGIATSFNNIGNIYFYQKNYEQALNNYLKSLKLQEEIENKKGIADAYNNMGSVYFSQKNYEKALNNHLKSLKISEEIGSKRGIGNSYGNIGCVLMKQSKFEESYQYLNKSIILFKKIGYKDGIKEMYVTISELYDKKGDYKNAYNYHKMYSDIKDTLLNEQSSKQIAEMNTKYESEKKEKDILLLTKDKNLQQAEIGKQKFIRNGTIGGLVLALSLAFILFNRFRVTNKQKKIIESQNFQIVESINYSKKIQDSLLPSIDSMRKVIPDLFLFYEPKAIVSGDFYYFKQFEKYTILACVDCTGHGVPGGFMSTLGSLLLDKIVDDETLSPSEILNKLSDEIVRVLHQQDGGEIQDGMDLSVCLIDKNNGKIEFSGARNGIIIITNDQAKRYKADPLPVGGNYIKKGIAVERNFKTQHIPINANDWIYMYTDGFMEQVGGEAGIPMNYTQFENQLINVSKKKNSEEKNKLLKTELDNWRGTNERDDDVLIIGFQVT
ncbi:MAG: tetratricopeptide repeat protein [Bacteroidota bacterium]